MIVRNRIPTHELVEPFVKMVVDIRTSTLAMGGELHMDCAEELLAQGSKMKDLWGFNIYPDAHLDFISLINIKPAIGSRSMEIQSEEIKQKIKKLIASVLEK